MVANSVPGGGTGEKQGRREVGARRRVSANKDRPTSDHLESMAPGMCRQSCRSESLTFRPSTNVFVASKRNHANGDHTILRWRKANRKGTTRRRKQVRSSFLTMNLQAKSDPCSSLRRSGIPTRSHIGFARLSLKTFSRRKHGLRAVPPYSWTHLGRHRGSASIF
jgi:hypothetical protein